ncbi:PREDICTED: DNA repair protein RAD51 homolog 4-like [Nicotiana attenuata]|uniref:DNA repair protein RAD51 homolog 4-like n=1 Tax=Nicotiana attenuata TaxID=49451 RepID=UPI00090484F4|nr:PREDICTED: DNA repair protein RAD51 homolog 4-like [Nicotiana attenuata]
MPLLSSMECDYPLIDSNFRDFCASHVIYSVEDFLLRDLYVLVISTEHYHNSERLKEGITQVLTIINGQHQPWVNGQELLDDALQNKSSLPTGCRRIDVFLHGGLKKGHLTELVSPSSSDLLTSCFKSCKRLGQNHFLGLWKFFLFKTSCSICHSDIRSFCL